MARLLKDLDYRLRVNHKRVSAGSGPDRDEQFQHIAQQRRKFAERGWPIVSIDTKKRELQTRLVDPHQLTLTVCHYPSGASKWNPIDHRLLSEISKNWAGVPLRNYETILNHIRTTTTNTGLSVAAQLVEQDYPTGICSCAVP